MPEAALSDADYVALADFRHLLRQFLSFSEAQAAELGLTPQQHQALLAIKAAGETTATIGYVANRLILKPHSTTGLVDRLEALGLVRRGKAADDGRRAVLSLTPKAEALLAELSRAHRDEIRRMRPMLEDLLGALNR